MIVKYICPNCKKNDWEFIWINREKRKHCKKCGFLAEYYETGDRTIGG